MEVFHFLEDIASWMSSLRVKNELKKMSHQRNQRKYGKKKKRQWYYAGLEMEMNVSGDTEI